MKHRVNKYNQPIGGAVSNWEARKFPSEVWYVGNYTIITRLADAHIQALYDVFKDTHPSNWTYLPDEPTHTYGAFEQLMLEKINNQTHIYYVVLNKETRKPLGIFSLMRIDQANGVIEVGNIHFSDAMQKTRMSTEAHYLLASYVFDELHYRLYEWKCDALNVPSMQTAKRLGFTYEGTFRNAVIYKGRSRDTSWFSMLLEEWPIHKQAFIQWLAEENFDGNGKQLHSLAACK